MNMARDAMGLGLRVHNRFAGLKAVDKLGLREPAEKASKNAPASIAGIDFIIFILSLLFGLKNLM